MILGCGDQDCPMPLAADDPPGIADDIGSDDYSGWQMKIWNNPVRHADPPAELGPEPGHKKSGIETAFIE
jgi:hypothetical protein